MYNKDKNRNNLVYQQQYMNQYLDIPSQVPRECSQEDDFYQTLQAQFMNTLSDRYRGDVYQKTVELILKLGKNYFVKRILQKYIKNSTSTPCFSNLYLFEQKLVFTEDMNRQQMKEKTSKLFMEIAIILHRYGYHDQSINYYYYVLTHHGKQSAAFYHHFHEVIIDIAKKYKSYQRIADQEFYSVYLSIYQRIAQQLCSTSISSYPEDIKIKHANLVCAQYFGTETFENIQKQLAKLQPLERQHPFLEDTTRQFKMGKAQNQDQSSDSESQSAEFSQESLLGYLRSKEVNYIKRHATKITYNAAIFTQLNYKKDLFDQLKDIHVDSINRCFRKKNGGIENLQALQSAISFFNMMAFQPNEIQQSFNYLGLGYLAKSMHWTSFWCFIDAIEAEPTFINSYQNLAVTIVAFPSKEQKKTMELKALQKLSRTLEAGQNDTRILFNYICFCNLIGNLEEYRSKLEILIKKQCAKSADPQKKVREQINKDYRKVFDKFSNICQKWSLVWDKQQSKDYTLQSHPHINHEQSQVHTVRCAVSQNIFSSMLSLFQGVSGCEQSSIESIKPSKFLQSSKWQKPQYYKTLNQKFCQHQHQIYHYIDKVTSNKDSKTSQCLIKPNYRHNQLKMEGLQMMRRFLRGKRQPFKLNTVGKCIQQQIKQRLFEIVTCLQELGIFHCDFEIRNLRLEQNEIKIDDYDYAFVYKNVSKDCQNAYQKFKRILQCILNMPLEQNQNSIGQYLFPLRFIIFGNFNQLDPKIGKQYQKQLLRIKRDFDSSGRKDPEKYVQQYLKLIQRTVPIVHQRFIDKIIKDLTHLSQDKATNTQNYGIVL